MRKASICLLVLLFSSLASFGQNEPQWKVVQRVVLIDQTNTISQTTLFTPTKPGVYRLTGYISATGNGAEWHLYLDWTDFAGSTQDIQMTATYGENIDEIGAYPFVPKVGVPFTYAVEGITGAYNIAFTIEQLQ
jgi:hypothetical protein